MAAYSCLFGNPFSWLAALGSFLAFSHSSGFGFLTFFLTSSALILCPVIVCRSKPTCREESARLCTEEAFSETTLQDVTSQVYKSSSKVRETVAEISEEAHELEKKDASIQEEPHMFEKESQICEKKEETKAREYLLSSSDALSDSESLDHTTSSEDSENDWIFGGKLNDSVFSDGSISDEESLIEIALPTGHYVDSDSERQQGQQSWYGFPQKCSDCSLESHFRQQTWMEMLNEMNEENLIEIDICMGSIKCSRFEIQA